jgi:hypothetical protein
VLYTGEVPGFGTPVRPEPSLSSAVMGPPLFETGVGSSTDRLVVTKGMVDSLRSVGVVPENALAMFLEMEGEKYGTHDLSSPVAIVPSDFYTTLRDQKKLGDAADYAAAFKKIPHIPRKLAWTAHCVVFVISWNLHYSVVLLQHRLGDKGPFFLHLDSCKGQGFHPTEDILGLLREGMVATCYDKEKEAGFAAMDM